MKFDKKLFFETIKRYSYYSDRIDWKKLESALEDTPEELNSVEAINSLLNIVDDHSFAVSKSKNEGASAEATLNNKEVVFEKISEDTGVLKLPGFYSPFNNEEDLNKNYKNIVNALQQVRGCSRLLLDLQDNSGGNMYPWFAALAPLYNLEVIGYFDYASKPEREAWRVREEGVFSGEKLWFPKINTDKYGFEKIAVCVSKKR